MKDVWPRQRVPLQQLRHLFPAHPCSLRATVEPLSPGSADLVEQAAQGTAVVADAVVGVVPSKLARQCRVLLLDALVAVRADPVDDAPERSTKPVLGRAGLGDPLAAEGLAPVVSEAQEIKRPLS